MMETPETTSSASGELCTVGERLEALQRQAEVIGAKLASLREPDEHLGEEQRERMRALLEEESDVELVGLLLTSQKVLEQHSRGKMRLLAEGQTTMLTAALGRFAPQAFADALAVWEEHAEEA
jgi:hypothetical protein